MTGQQYRVIADRDNGDDPDIDRDYREGDRLVFENWDTSYDDERQVGTLVRIERPVPTTENELPPLVDWERFDREVLDEHPPLPTREQIAGAQAAILRQVADEWAADPAAWGDNDRDYRNELRDRAAALLQKGADR